MENWINSYSVNMGAKKIIDEKVIPYAEELRIGVEKLPSGTTVIDMGIHKEGGFLAGKYFVEIGLGGLGECYFGKMKLTDHIVPSVTVKASIPPVSELSAHVAAFKVPHKDGICVVSGPIRALANGKDVFSLEVDYTDESDYAVGMIQMEEIPEDELAVKIANKAGIAPENLTLVVARTSTIVGAIQVCARNVEQVLPTLVDRGFPMDCVVEAIGTTPVVSVVDDEEIAYGRVNDCLIYGQESTIYVRCEDKLITDMLSDIPFSKNEDIFGLQFQYLWEKCGKSWATVPRDWDAPCKVNFVNLTTGNVYSTGKLSYPTLERSFIGEGGIDYEK